MQIKLLAIIATTVATVAVAADSNNNTTDSFTTLYKKFIHDSNKLLPSTSPSGTLIVGGTEAPFGKYRHTVGLRQTSGTEASFCGGSLIDRNHVLTAGHCVDDYDNTPAYVALGTHFLKGDTRDAQIVKVKKWILHPQYNPDDLIKTSDVAILELEESANEDIPTISLADEAAEENVGTSAVICGWGVQEEQGEVQSPVLLEASVSVVSNNECSQNITKVLLGMDGNLPGGFTLVDDSMVCTRGTSDSTPTDSCQNDSGGPMFTTMEDDGAYVQLGVVSWGIGCARENIPGVYARVSKAREFIDANASPTWRSVGKKKSKCQRRFK